MHSVLTRLNAIFCYAIVIVAALVGCNIVTTYWLPANPQVDFQVTTIQSLLRHHVNHNDHATITFDLDADLTSLFNWNTKQLFVFIAAEFKTEKNVFNQVVLWDDIIQQKEQAHIKKFGSRIEYVLVDQGNGLR